MPLFKTERQRELEREIRFRAGKAKVQRFIQSTRRLQKRLWELGKRALRWDDQGQFRRLAGAYLRSREQVQRWERYLLELEFLDARREEAAATREFIESIAATTASILRGSSPEEVVRMRTQMERALAKSSALEEMLDVALEAGSEAVFGAGDLDPEKLAEISRAMEAEAGSDEAAAFDGEIAEGLKKIAEEMRREGQ